MKNNQVKILLFGMPCSGKTTFGCLLANYFKCLFIDIDAKIAERVGINVRSFYLANGKEAFQRVEYEIFSEYLSLQTTNNSPLNNLLVISAGGGLIENEKARLLLEKEQKAKPDKIKVFFLHVPKNILFNRLLKKAKQEKSFPAFLQPYIQKNINEKIKWNRLSFSQLKLTSLGKAKHKFFSLNKDRIKLFGKIKHIKLKTKRKNAKHLFKIINTYLN